MSGEAVYPIPPFFRMLIIDDKVAASTSWRELLRNLVTSMILETATSDLPKLENIDIVIEGNPAEGFKRWQDEPFDFTLIDADFSKNGPADVQDHDDLTKYMLNSREQGFHILSLLKAKMDPNREGAFTFRNGMCRLFLWTAMSKEDKPGKGNNVVPGWGSLLKKFGLVEKDILAKMSPFFKELHVSLKKIINKIQRGDFSPEQAIERLLFAFKKDYGNTSCDINGGCLFNDVEGRFPFLHVVGKEDSTIRLCMAHIPVALWDKPYVPLRNNSGNSILDTLSLLQGGVVPKSLEAYCKSLKERQQVVQKGADMPWYHPSVKRDAGKAVKQPAYIAAATPLTGISVTGEKQAIASLGDKVIALLQGPFDKVILKTTYLDRIDQWEDTWWPSVQVQSHLRSRCLYPDTGSPTLWNSGKTAMETLPPRQMNRFLKELLTREPEASKRVVVSLGSKYPLGRGMARIYDGKVERSLTAIWQRLFEETFNNLPSEFFPFVEINVRHFLREIVTYYLGGDEYLTPRTLNEKSVQDPENYWREFRLWLSVIHRMAVAYKKRLILKLPYRSDALAYAECIISLREHHLVSCHGDKASDFGVRGMTVVNALKSQVPRYDDKLMPDTPAWYADPLTWGDANGKLYQMSGRFVGPYRNQILSGLLSGGAMLRSLGLEIWVSGGLTSGNEVRFCQNWMKEKWSDSKDFDGQGAATGGIQIGTWALLSTDLNKTGKENWEERKGPTGPAKVRRLLASKTTFSRDVSPKGNRKAFWPRFSFLNTHRCRACGQCSQTFYCDTFLDRVHTDLPPLMDSRYCSGCGLCVQVCSSGALQLYPSENFLVLLSASRERKELLDTLHIPHLQYHPKRDLDRFPEWIQGYLLSVFEQSESGEELEKRLKAFKMQLNDFWNNRIKRDRFMLHEDEPVLYPEKRKERKAQCVNVAEKLFAQLAQISSPPVRTQEAIRRAMIWSQLLWSDPGQVLWDSFLLSIQSEICLQDGTVLGMEFNDVIRDNMFNIKTWVVLLRQGQVLLSRELDDGKCAFLLSIKGQAADAYQASGFGKGRAAGIDIRACGNVLVRYADGKPLQSDAKNALAGLPWASIHDAVINGPPPQYTGTKEEYGGHVKAFERLSHTVI
ncbi:MAG: hypothetical protein F9K32_13505 [Desulfobulbaceae bacterium]|nr:MAG: hypothetical protein F9K32_13505 [Desulfobulbaceae bacterium]